TKTFHTPAGAFPALRGVDLTIAAGEFVAIVGRSGSGKSTLLNLVAGIDTPTSGTVAVGGTALAGLSHDRLATWRGRNVGVVFQFSGRVRPPPASETSPRPGAPGGSPRGGGRAARAGARRGGGGVPERGDRRPAPLPGGQQGGVGLAGAPANAPPLLVAD